MVVTYWNCGDVSPDDVYAATGFNPADLPPEFTRYRDEGCPYGESCLDCPYETCLYELSTRNTACIRLVQHTAMREAFRRGASRRQLAERFRVSYRTVLRVVDGCRDSPSAEALFAMEQPSEEKGERYDPTGNDSTTTAAEG